MSYSTPATSAPANLPVISVSDLTSMIKEVLEAAFPAVWIRGEVSNLSRPSSGHCYLTLKDENAQIRAVIWRSTAQRMRFDLEDGMQVICRGNVDVYGPRGSYQLVIQQLEPAGMGALELALRKLREKLAAEGLFDPARKRPLPRFPRRIGFVTSPTGAAIRDFLEVLCRRWDAARLLVIPARVQGSGAASEIADGIRRANRLRPRLDVLVVGRGGGSLEDLWAFNEEVVIRAIAASEIPVVSAVGHEIDVTLSDLVADLRALTPSEAAERVVPSRDEVIASLKNFQNRLALSLQNRLASARDRLQRAAAARCFRRPLDAIHDSQQRLDELETRGRRAMANLLQYKLSETKRLAGKLDSLSPLAVLARGYSVTHREPGSAVVRSPSDVVPGDLLRTRLAEGEILSRVEPPGPDGV